jgi:hypothetical protein
LSKPPIKGFRDVARSVGAQAAKLHLLRNTDDRFPEAAQITFRFFRRSSWSVEGHLPDSASATPHFDTLDLSLKRGLIAFLEILKRGHD